MKKRNIRLLLSALLVLVMAFQSFAAPLSYAGPTAASEPAKITGTWSTDASGNWFFNAQDGAAKNGWYYLNTTNKATGYNWFCFDENGVMRTGWVQDKNDPSVWYYTGESKDSSEGGLAKGWITDPQDGKKYYLDPSTGIMCHGWKQVSGVWYYFGESRYSDRKWAPDTTGYWKAGASGKHSYGSLYMNEWTPDGYYVGANGVWVQNHSEDDNSDKPDPIPEYSITVENDGNGTASASAQKSAAGKEITLTAAPNEGYQFKAWDVISGGVTVAGNKFTMPANNVTVKAVFKNKEVPVTSVSLDKTEVTIEVGDEDVKLSAIVLPENATDKSVNWSSSKESVATVDSEGNVTAVSTGTATITVTTVDGNKTATCAVKVAAPAPETYTVTFDLNGITGTAPTAQTIEKDGKVTKPAEPTDAIHTFAGWYKTKDATTGALSDPWDFDNGTVTADMTLYAQWTRTLGSIYGTNENVPKSDNNTAPYDAWENGDGGKAFIAYSGKNSEVLYLYKKLESSGAQQLSCRKTENFTKIGDDYVLDYYLSSSFYGKYTLHMTDSKFTSVTYNGAGTDYEVLSGTYSESQCIAAGTMISMPGGTQKAVEELEIGDVICTFDHETGDVSSAPVCFIWESKNVGNAFTLTFEDDIEVTVIEAHGFYDQEEQKYVFINLQNAEEYIGHRFYNADTNSWLELKSCEALNNSVDAYEIITSGDLNHMSNGMLSVSDDKNIKILANLFEYDDQMRFDADKKKADIETYGLTPIEKILEFDGFIEADYVDYNLKYLNVAIGKGLTTWEQIKAFSDYCVANGLVCIEQTNDVPMLGTEEMEPIIIALAPRSKPESCEPEKFEEAKPEELIEPAEAVAEEAAP